MQNCFRARLEHLILHLFQILDRLLYRYDYLKVLNSFVVDKLKRFYRNLYNVFKNSLKKKAMSFQKNIIVIIVLLLDISFAVQILISNQVSFAKYIDIIMFFLFGHTTSNISYFVCGFCLCVAVYVIFLSFFL